MMLFKCILALSLWITFVVLMLSLCKAAKRADEENQDAE